MMGWLWRRKLRRYAAPAGGGADPLAARPLAGEGVEARDDEAGLIQLRRPHSPGRGAEGLLARLMGPRHARVNLDERGSFFWRQIDGRRDLHAIARLLAGRFDLSDADARAAVVVFVRVLMVRGLIRLEVDAPAGRREARS